MLLLGLVLVSGAGADTLESVEIENAFPLLSFQSAVHLTGAGDGSGRVWVVTQPGIISVFPNSISATSTTTFLDIQGRVDDSGSEKGLLGLAFDPDYQSNGHFFVNYTADSPFRTVVSRFSVSVGDLDAAELNSELVVLEVTQPFGNHNGGTLAFGPDGHLYIGLGDGGSGGDPQGYGQDTSTLLGAILRIDVNAATSSQPYAIPTDNPFVGSPSGEMEEIWAYGVRNPWRFSFDPVGGDLWAGDVGQGDYEEIDVIEKGLNYGWNVMEGDHCYPPAVQTCDQTGLESPIYEYPISGQEDCAIIGGHVYRGSRRPGLTGAYVYADYCSGRISGLRYDGESVTEVGSLSDTALSITALGTDDDNELYIVTPDTVYRLVESSAAPVPGLTILGLVALAVSLLGAGWVRASRPEAVRASLGFCRSRGPCA